MLRGVLQIRLPRPSDGQGPEPKRRCRKEGRPAAQDVGEILAEIRHRHAAAPQNDAVKGLLRPLGVGHPSAGAVRHHVIMRAAETGSE
jgi:hypothetical protein